MNCTHNARIDSLFLTFQIQSKNLWAMIRADSWYQKRQIEQRTISMCHKNISILMHEFTQKPHTVQPKIREWESELVIVCLKIRIEKKARNILIWNQVMFQNLSDHGLILLLMLSFRVWTMLAKTAFQIICREMRIAPHRKASVREPKKKITKRINNDHICIRNVICTQSIKEEKKTTSDKRLRCYVSYTDWLKFCLVLFFTRISCIHRYIGCAALCVVAST